MKYLLLAYADEALLTEEKRQACYAESTGVTQELDRKGQFYAASPLQSVNLATSVRVREGRRLVTDGPFAETREQLGGYFLIEAADLDQAIEIASQIPVARFGTVEIRPVVELPNLPRKFAEGELVR